MPNRFISSLALAFLVAAQAMPLFVPSSLAAQIQDPTFITRAGAVALLVEGNPRLRSRIAHFDRHMPPLPLFSDIEPQLWYGPYLEVAFEAGIIDGTRQTFRPAQNLTVEEAATLLARFRETMDPPPPQVLTLQSNSPRDWFTGSIQQALTYGIELPFPIKLGYPITRAEFFTMLRSAHVVRPESIALTVNPKRGILEPVIAQAPRAPAYRQPSTVQRPAMTQRPAVTPGTQATVQPVAQQPVAQAPTSGFRISMPALGVKDLTITHPADALTSQGLLAPLKYGVGHLFSYPGKGGKILIYGHSSSYPWDISNFTKIFRQINKLEVGDRITVTYDGSVHTYEVTHKQTVPARDMSAYQGGGTEELILYTCWPPDSIAQRYLVHAKPVDAVAQR